MMFAGSDGEVSASLESRSVDPLAFSAETSVANWGREQNMVRAWRSCMLPLSIVTSIDLESV